MSAAPLLSAGCARNSEARVKRSRMDDAWVDGGSLHFEKNYLTESPAFVSNLEKLLLEFPMMGDGVVGSILESSFNEVDQARFLIGQILSVGNKKATVAKSHKRTLYDRDMHDVQQDQEPQNHGPGLQNNGLQNLPDSGSKMINDWVCEVLNDLAGVQSVEDAAIRLRPAAEKLLSSSATKSRSMQRMLTVALLRQSERIQQLERSTAEANAAAEVYRNKVKDLEVENDGLSQTLKRTRDANSILQYYVRSTFGNGCGDRDFSGGFESPDVC
jgi:hypothetical protein